MKSRTKVKKILQIFIPLALIFLLLALFIPYKTSLVFYIENTDQIQAFLPIEEGESFQTIYTHSIHLTDVVEKSRVTDDHQIMTYELVYEHFGIGMPSNAYEGETFVYEDGKYHIKNMERIFPSINIRNGKTVSKHRLVWGEEGEHIVWFNDYFKPGGLYTMKIDNLSLWQIMRGVKIHE